MTESTEDMKSIPKVQRIIAVFWPSFFTAGIATALFFAAFDPIDLGAVIGIEDVDRLEFYSIGFFLLWILTASSSSLTRYFEKPVDEINRAMRT